MNANTLPEQSSAVPRAKTGRKRILMILLIILAGAAAIVYGLHWWTVGRFIEDTDDAYVGGELTVVATKVPGYIARVAVVDNQAVHAGDLLIKIDDRDYVAALAKADGAVAAQQAALANLDATAKLQQAVIAQARATVSATSADSVRAHEDQVRRADLRYRYRVFKKRTPTISRPWHTVKKRMRAWTPLSDNWT
jgi:membrane fusion protein (multidrug efflux system)